MKDGSGIRYDAHGYPSAVPLGHHPTGKPVTTYARGRACIKCNRPLSIYNPDDICGPCDQK